MISKVARLKPITNTGVLIIYREPRERRSETVVVETCSVLIATHVLEQAPTTQTYTACSDQLGFAANKTLSYYCSRSHVLAIPIV